LTFYRDDFWTIWYDIRYFLRNLFYLRHFKWWWQRKWRGFDDRELWSLDFTVCKFLVPRLKVFRESNRGYPVSLSSSEEWNEIVDKITWSISKWVETCCWIEEEDRERFDEGMELFHKYFFDLWI